METNRNYIVEAVLFYTAAATTTGLGLSLNGPATPVGVRFGVVIPTTTTAVFTNSATAYNTILLASASPSTTVPAMATLAGVIENGTTAGNLTVRFSTEVASSGVTILARSYFRVTPI